MKDAIKQICQLQPFYSAANTPSMQERGKALRYIVKPAVEAMEPILADVLGEYASDYLVEASDGIGRKTELPWVRFCSKIMSPAPTEGFYGVMHFSTDGSAVHITVGCGSSRFHKGSSVPLPDEELDAQTAWARAVVSEHFGTLDPFVDTPDFGAKRPLPKSFQRATALSKRIAYSDIHQTDFSDAIREAAKRLRVIYDAQSSGRDLSPSDQLELEVAALMNPNRGKGSRQGYGLPPAARRKVELRAMIVAQQWLENEGYIVRDCSAHQPFDLEAKRDGTVLKVEVKGTTSDRADSILMTRNEVDLHYSECGATALIIVSRIQLLREGGEYSAAGGIADAMIGWSIADWHIEPTAYRLTKSHIV